MQVMLAKVNKSISTINFERMLENLEFLHDEWTFTKKLRITDQYVHEQHDSFPFLIFSTATVAMR